MPKMVDKCFISTRSEANCERNLRSQCYCYSGCSICWRCRCVIPFLDSMAWPLIRNRRFNRQRWYPFTGMLQYQVLPNANMVTCKIWAKWTPSAVFSANAITDALWRTHVPNRAACVPVSGRCTKRMHSYDSEFVFKYLRLNFLRKWFICRRWSDQSWHNLVPC